MVSFFYSIAAVSLLAGAGWHLLGSGRRGEEAPGDAPSFEPALAKDHGDAGVQQMLPLAEYAQSGELEVSPARAAPLCESVALSDGDIDAVRREKWFIFVYAPWCPYSQAYHAIWRKLPAALLKGEAAGKAPRLATVSITHAPALAAWLHTQKLPTFVMVDEGLFKGSAFSMPSLENLVEFALADWSVFNRYAQRLPLRASPMGTVQMVIFDAIGSFVFTKQGVIVNYLTDHRLLCYALFAFISAAVLFLGKSRTLRGLF